MAKKDIIKIKNTSNRANLSNLTSDTLEVGELALVTEKNYERLYCKNSNGDVVPIHRIADAGEIEIPNYADICVADTTNGNSLLIIKNSKWSAEKYPIDTYVPVGVVVIPASHNHYADGKCAIMSLNHMRYDTPIIGGAGQTMMWGVNDTDIETLTNLNQVPYIGNDGVIGDTVIGQAAWGRLPSDYSSFTAVTNPYDEGTNYYYNTGYCIASPYMNDGSFNPNYSLTDSPSSNLNCLADFDGYGNTKKILEVRGSKDYSSWLPTNVQEDYPAASCCDMYSTVGIPQGSWYLPSAGELGYIVPRRQALDDCLTKLKNAGLSQVSNLVSSYYWSSSESSSGYASGVGLLTGSVGSYGKDNTGYARAFARV